MNFIDWLKKIEIKAINKKYKEGLKNYDFDSLIKDYISKDLEIEKNKLEETIKKINLNKEIEDKNILILKDWLIDLYDILCFFSEENMKFNKVWKYKILYFIYGGFIYYQEYLKKYFEKRGFKKRKNFNFFINEEKIKWFAFEKGPITNHYKFLGKDESININIEKNDIETKEILEDFYLILKKNSLETLIEESHKTDPWEKAFKKNEKERPKWQEIKGEEIISYFKENIPFYLEKPDE
ncbi:MAG: hypothetical protein HPAVJP_3790 [Candidatus Hepatoplasma vulgare]|nr:MAG: hypothetical protein HPAVJP_3790 [Candidatus Hepatoplasma sp.]